MTKAETSIGRHSPALEAALAYFVVCAAFMTCDRHPQQFVLAGIAISLEAILLAAAAQHGQSASVAGRHMPVAPAFAMRRPVRAY